MSRLDTAKKALAQPGMRAMIAFVVVMIALVAALWPRGGDEPASAPAPSSSAPTSGVTDAGASADEVAQARAAAALTACPSGTGPATGVLAGVSAPCMADGQVVDLGTVTAGRPLVINMWAVWCLPCRRELPLFDRLAAQAGDRLNVLAVHAKEGADKEYFVLKFLQELNAHLPVVTDPHGDIAKAVAAPRVFPSTVMIRADGTVAAVLPRVFDTYQDLTSAVREHLGVDVGEAS
ncbi:TlpA family protein disulfide reductase [Gordonia liuliyuniae]|uniref:TlpA family protein disulfide reductase n=1 Tax=Gordonia liuliyuniae TaxID=2911517 RepID=A0ABS9IT15_9ACTN|nr:TlpA disulfide reductase family protein [Gordonia liuliyuniae]MCF8588694.1 TlpA family protein disulfide reductase [Gordonia liuliyuniae]